MKKLLIIVILSICALLIRTHGAFALSTAAKSLEEYTYLMNCLRDVRVMIENFASEEQKKKYEEIASDFKDASVSFYGHNFTFFDKDAKKHRRKFYLVKLKLSELLDGLAQSYISRSKEILHGVSKDSFNILIKFDKGGYRKYFTKPHDPVSLVQGEKIYKSEEYHLYYDKSTIERYLNKGYKTLQDAQNIYNHPDMEVVKAKKEKNDYDLHYMVESFLAVIKNCREAKQYGIEIYKIIRKNNIYAIQKKYENYNIPITSPEPIFDVRIPENYKIDANDNLQLIHSIELKKLPPDFPKSISVE
ncbi:MAG: hypothetical protein N2316_00900 [Spirochaetes bacterium]|nr:hypothetical protein [Spirochaetota bacterium]